MDDLKRVKDAARILLLVELIHWLEWGAVWALDALRVELPDAVTRVGLGFELLLVIAVYVALWRSSRAATLRLPARGLVVLGVVLLVLPLTATWLIDDVRHPAWFPVVQLTPKLLSAAYALVYVVWWRRAGTVCGVAIGRAVALAYLLLRFASLAASVAFAWAMQRYLMDLEESPTAWVSGELAWLRRGIGIVSGLIEIAVLWRIMRGGPAQGDHEQTVAHFA
jgi:hypothetical protein